MIHLKIHVESIHEGVRYPCDKCPYKATTISSLKRHGESIHEGVCYSCHGGGGGFPGLSRVNILCICSLVLYTITSLYHSSANVTCKF